MGSPTPPGSASASSVVSAAPSASAAPTAEPTVAIGRVVAIELQNISKALGHYNYNVHLVVEGAVEGAWPFAGPRPSRLEVRIAKVYWGELDDATRATLAPSGPKERLTPARFEGYAVGDAVRLPVRATSPGLATLEPR